jgi:hypothetical protein
MLSGLRLLILLLISFSIPEAVQACSCSELPVDLPIKEMGIGIPEANYRATKSDIIFEGILIDWSRDSTTRRRRNVRMLFEVTDVYKGNCIDSIVVWTNPDVGGNCGFWAKEGNYAIVFVAKDDNLDWYTLRSDCWQGANQGLEPTRFNKFRSFLISIVYQIDGAYTFYQQRHYWPLRDDPRKLVPNIEYTIKNGLLDGPWLLYNRRGKVVESGTYRSGRRRGTWIYRRKIDVDSYPSYREELVSVDVKN